MNKITKTIASVTPGELLPKLPPGLERKAKKYYNNTEGMPQVFMGSKAEYIHSYLYGSHGERHLVYKLPLRYRRGSHVVKALLVTMQKSISFLGHEFHLRHLLPSFSSYFTLTIIEEEHIAKSNLLNVGHIRDLMETRKITTYDLSAKTSKFRGMFAEDSINVASTRYIV